MTVGLGRDGVRSAILITALLALVVDGEALRASRCAPWLGFVTRSEESPTSEEVGGDQVPAESKPESESESHGSGAWGPAATTRDDRPEVSVSRRIVSLNPPRRVLRQPRHASSSGGFPLRC